MNRAFTAKKLLLLVLALGLLLSGCGREETPAGTLTREELIYGPTETSLDGWETVYIPEGQEAITEPPTDTVTVYRLTRMTMYLNGQPLWHREYSYDSLGQQVGERELASDGTESYSMTLTQEGTVQTWTYAYADGRTGILRKTLGDGGELRTEELTENGQITCRTEYSYDDSGLATGYVSTYPQDGITLSCVYEYDAAGNRVAVRELMDGVLEGYTLREFDDQGREVRACYYGPDDTLLTVTETVWEGNTEIRTQSDPEGNLLMVNLRTYDDRGNLLLDENQQEGSVVNATEYTYEPFEIPQ